MSEKTIRGLLIEDDPDDVLLFMNHMKAARGPVAYSFETAASLREGLDVLARGGVDVVLLDMNLPDARGLETLRKLRESHPDVPVVLLTGLADENVGMEALRHGAQDYQVKGHVDGRGLKRTIGYAVERHRLLVELRRLDQLKAEVRERKMVDQMKDDLMSTVSHEMRNPLTVIKVIAGGLAESMKGRLTRQESEMIAMQCRNIARLEKIVGRILELSRLESGRATISRQAVDARRLVRDVVEGFRMTAKGRVNYVEELPEDLPRVDADPDLLAQVLANLVDNASRYAHSRVAVRIETEPAGSAPAPRADGGRVAAPPATGFLRFSVSDDGEGIPRERVGDLFNKFVQVNRSSKGSGYKGTGLGLAICKEIVERHGGRIWAESAEGLGSAFRFTLPVHAEG